MNKKWTRARRIALYATLTCAALLSTCSPKPTALQRVLETEQLRVAMVESPTSCYNAASGPTGFECDLLNGLAKALGVTLQLHFVDSAQAAVDALKAGQADLAAGGIAVSVDDPSLRFSAPLQDVVLQLIYRSGSHPPADVDQLGGTLGVVAGSSAIQVLTRLQAAHPKLRWTASTEDSEEDQIDAVAKGTLDYTVAPSNLIAIEQRYYPNLRVAFALSDQQHLAWAMRPSNDDALYSAVQKYLHKLGEIELARVRDRYFGHAIDFDYQGVARFASDVQTRLPRYQKPFRAAATRFGLDWRMLAAIGYQESHWDPDAVSYTGVRGLMMLTTDTATALDIADRGDPAQSILGGARYLSLMLKLLPPEIVEPDRTWMALAAYNQGIAHLEDARQLAATRGGDPNRWLDVRNVLPLLSRPQWYSQTHAGYARGREAVNFVTNVRNYFDILNWMATDQSQDGDKTDTMPSAAEVSRAIRSASARPRGLRANGSG